MSVLPQFLFLFQNLPIFISNKTLQGWQRELLGFLWGGKAHRVNKSFLSRPGSLGGFGLPMLEQYYVAAQLRSIYTYLNRKPMLGWCQIEEFFLAPKTLMESVWNYKTERPKSLLLNPFLSLTLRVWDSHRSKVVNSPSIATTFMGQSWFPPALGSKDFLLWKTHGIVRFWDIVQKGKLLTKSQIEQKFKVEIPWFQFRQIHDLFLII